MCKILWFRYQGQQNDYIILSLVRTGPEIGHVRDVRRLIVALSRARLGLYVFGRRALFENCYELKPAFNRLLRPIDGVDLVVDKLELELNEQWPVCERRPSDRNCSSTHRVNGGLLELGALVASMLKMECSFDRRSRNTSGLGSYLVEKDS